MLLKRKYLIKLLMLFSFFSIFSGIYLISNKHLNSHKEKEIQKENINNYFTVEEEKILDEKYNYIGVLEIPSIALSQGLVDINNIYNDINHNVEILKESTMPNIEKGNLILSGHNGNTNMSYFKDISKMNKDDLIYVYYQHKKYIYYYSHYYEVNKNGSINIIRDLNKTTITLITCKDNTTDKQLVFIGYLIDVIDY